MAIPATPLNCLCPLTASVLWLPLSPDCLYPLTASAPWLPLPPDCLCPLTASAPTASTFWLPLPKYLLQIVLLREFSLSPLNHQKERVQLLYHPRSTFTTYTKPRKPSDKGINTYSEKRVYSHSFAFKQVPQSCKGNSIGLFLHQEISARSERCRASLLRVTLSSQRYQYRSVKRSS